MNQFNYIPFIFIFLVWINDSAFFLFYLFDLFFSIHCSFVRLFYVDFLALLVLLVLVPSKRRRLPWALPPWPACTAGVPLSETRWPYSLASICARAPQRLGLVGGLTFEIPRWSHSQKKSCTLHFLWSFASGGPIPGCADWVPCPRIGSGLGRYPITSARGAKYVMIMYDYNSGYMNAFTMKSRKSDKLVRAFKVGYDELLEAGPTGQLMRLNNEISKDLINAIK